MTPEIEEALGLLYKGQTNVAVKAKRAGAALAATQTAAEGLHQTDSAYRRRLE